MHMSTPNEQPPYGQDPSGSDAAQSHPQNADAGATPPGYQPPPGYDAPAAGEGQPQPGYQQQPYQQQPYQQQAQPPYQQPGYQQQPNPQPNQAPNYQQPYQAPQQPGYQQQPAGDSSFQMPTSWPKGANDIMPAGGFSSIFKVDGLPQMIKVSYIVWLIVGGLSILGSALSIIVSLAFFSPRGVIVSIISLAVAAAVILVAMKLKEGLPWARIVLTALTVLSIILTFVGGSVGWLGVVATVFMWLPESSAWLNSRSQNTPR